MKPNNIAHADLLRALGFIQDRAYIRHNQNQRAHAEFKNTEFLDKEVTEAALRGSLWFVNMIDEVLEHIDYERKIWSSTLKEEPADGEA